MQRTLYALTYCSAMAVAVALTPLVVVLARRCGIVDLPNSRKVHSHPTPRLGGLAIAAAMIGIALSAIAGSGIGFDRQLLVVSVAAIAVLVVGVFDDLLNLPSKFKLLVLIAASIAVCVAGVRIDSIVLHSYPEIHLGWFAWPLTTLWLVGITVSINFIDGLDGLAAGIAAIACGVIAVTASCSGQTALTILALSLLGSLTGFLFFNFNPAKVFMGDCGSMFIGFVLASLSLLQAPKLGTTVGLMLPLLALSVPILDTVLTFIRRGVIQRGSVFSAERGHIHHRLLDLGLCQRHAVLVLYSASLVSAGVGLLALLNYGWPTLAGLVLVLPLLIGLFRTAGSTRVRETVAAIRRNRAIGRETKRHLHTFGELQLKFRNVRDFESWWREICEAADRLDFLRVEIPLTRRDGSLHLLEWVRQDERGAGSEVLEVTIPIRQRRSGTLLRANIEVFSDTFLEIAGQRIALFSRLMGDHSLLSLPETAKRTRARGPSFKKLDNVPGIVNRHIDPNPHPSGKFRHRGEKSSATPALFRLTPEPQRMMSPSGIGLAATLDNTDVPGLHVQHRQSDLDGLKIAVVHDFLYCYAGAERVLEQIIRVFPQADLFSLFDFLPAEERGFLQDKVVKTTFIQKLPFARYKHRAYLPFMPLAIEQLDVSQYDIVISSSYLAAKGVLTRPDQLHVCYCHTPVRFAWDLQHQYLGVNGWAAGIKSLLPRLVFHYIRSWDLRSAHCVDVFVTNSNYVGRRIEKIYRRRAATIYPPVDTDRFSPGAEKEDFYLTASRLVPYKRVDLIVEAFNRMPHRRLIVVGDGPEFEKIRAMAGKNIKLVGHQPVEQLKHYMQLARAFVFAAEEDFGIVPVEAQACGTPVIAFGRGGVTESVVPNQTGIFFHEQTPESIVSAVEKFERKPHWEQETIRQNAERFSISRFREGIHELVKIEWNSFLERRCEIQTDGRPRNDHAPSPTGDTQEPALTTDSTLTSEIGNERRSSSAALLAEGT